MMSMNFSVSGCLLETRLNLTSREDLSDADKVMWTLVLITISIGNLLCSGILHYERFGGDSAKRRHANFFITPIIFQTT